MLFTEQLSKDEVFLAWLTSEWKTEWNDPSRSPSRELLDKADPKDYTENKQRADLLLQDLGRAKILAYMPPIVGAQRVVVEENDLAKLYLVSSSEWLARTRKKFRLIDNVGPLADADTDRKIEMIDARFGDAIADQSLILIAANQSGPYSIIDGNHRAIALYRRYARQLNTPWKGILITHPQMSGSAWHKGPWLPA